MNREYHKWYSSRLGRDMELLVFGHAGLPVLVFPTSGGRFYEFEDRGMIGAVAGQIEGGHLQFYLRRLGRHGELVQPQCSAALAYRPPRAIRGLPDSRSRSADPPEELGPAPCLARLQLRRIPRHQHRSAPSRCLHRAALHVGRIRSLQFPQWLLRPGLLLQSAHALFAEPRDPGSLTTIAATPTSSATGWDDQCLAQNQNLDRIMSSKGIPHKLYTWETYNSHDWPTWQR